jgi:hypothetical protein
MINDALQIIVAMINDYIGVAPPEVTMGSISLIDAFQDTSSQSLNDKVIASVVNIEQEATLRNLPFRKTIAGEDGAPRTLEQSPEICLNIYVLFGANKPPQHYDQALLRISQIIGFFQKKNVFVPADTPALSSAGIEKLIFDLHTLRFEELNNLWSINGGKYIPSVLYKMRMIIIQHADQSEAAQIRAVGLNPQLS